MEKLTCEEDEGSGSAEFPHDTLDHNYVEQNVFSNTDRFLEDDLFVKDLKTWHVIFFVSAGTLVAIITLCCFVRLRLPRTKSEIEANARRKDLLQNFNSKLRTLKSTDMEDLDYRNALEKLREEFKADSESLAHSEAISILSYDD